MLKNHTKAQINKKLTFFMLISRMPVPKLEKDRPQFIRNIFGFCASVSCLTICIPFFTSAAIIGNSYSAMRRKVFLNKFNEALEDSPASVQTLLNTYRKKDSKKGYLKDLKLSKNMAFEGMDFSRLQLTNIRMQNANLSRAIFLKSDLSGADLKNGDLSHAIMAGTNLRNANLKGTDLTETDLRGADLSDANLKHAKISDEKLYKLYKEFPSIQLSLVKTLVFYDRLCKEQQKEVRLETSRLKSMGLEQGPNHPKAYPSNPSAQQKGYSEQAPQF